MDNFLNGFPRLQALMDGVPGYTDIHEAGRILRDRLHAAGYRKIAGHELLTTTLPEAEAFLREQADTDPKGTHHTHAGDKRQDQYDPQAVVPGGAEVSSGGGEV